MDKALNLQAPVDLDVLLLGLRLRGMDDSSSMRRSWEREDQKAQSILFSGADELAEMASALGRDSYLRNPFAVEQIFALVEQ